MSAAAREINMTHTAWGHNFSVIDWPKGELFIWATPGPRKGDTLILQGHKGLIRAEVVDVRWTGNVDDMYKIRVAPEGTPNE